MVAYEPISKREAPRIYVDSSIVFSKLKLNELEDKLKESRDVCIKLKMVYDEEAVKKSILLSFASNYLVSRVALDVYADFKGKFIVYLLPKFTDVLIKRVDVSEPKTAQAKRIDSFKELTDRIFDGTCIDSIIARPTNLKPIETEQSKLLASAVLPDDWFDYFKEKAIKIGPDYDSECEMKHNTMQKRWKRSINKVIQQNECAKVRFMLSQRPIPAAQETLTEKIKRLAPINKKKSSDLSIEGFSKGVAAQLKQFASNMSEDELKYIVKTAQMQRGLRESNKSNSSNISHISSAGSSNIESLLGKYRFDEVSDSTAKSQVDTAVKNTSNLGAAESESEMQQNALATCDNKDCVEFADDDSNQKLNGSLLQHMNSILGKPSSTVMLKSNSTSIINTHKPHPGRLTKNLSGGLPKLPSLPNTNGERKNHLTLRKALNSITTHSKLF